MFNIRNCIKFLICLAFKNLKYIDLLCLFYKRYSNNNGRWHLMTKCHTGYSFSAV